MFQPILVWKEYFCKFPYVVLDADSDWQKPISSLDTNYPDPNYTSFSLPFFLSPIKTAYISSQYYYYEWIFFFLGYNLRFSGS